MNYDNWFDVKCSILMIKISIFGSYLSFHNQVYDCSHPCLLRFAVRVITLQFISNFVELDNQIPLDFLPWLKVAHKKLL